MVTCKLLDHTNLKDIFQGAPKSTSRLATPRDIEVKFVVIKFELEKKILNTKIETEEKIFTENLFLVKVLFRVKVLFVKSSYHNDPPVSKTYSLTGGQGLNGDEADQIGKLGPDLLSLSFITCTSVTISEVMDYLNQCLIFI